MRTKLRMIIGLFLLSWLAPWVVPHPTGLGASGLVNAANPNVGTTGFGFLKIGPAARPAALGDAFIAAQGDINSIGLNPASLATIRGLIGTAAYTNYLLDTQAGFVGFGKPLGEKGTLGVGIHYMSYGDFQKTDKEGKDLGSFGASDLALQICLSRFVLKNLSVGTGLKVLYSKIDTYSSDAYAFDLGILFKPPIKGLWLGASALNIGFVRSGYRRGFEETLPVNFKLGFAHHLAHLPLMILGDVDLPNDNDPYFSIGGEFTVAETMFLRGGYNSLYDDLEKENWAGASFGTGFVWKAYQVDYAYSSLAELGKVHRISLSGRF